MRFTTTDALVRMESAYVTIEFWCERSITHLCTKLSCRAIVAISKSGGKVPHTCSKYLPLL